MYSSKRCFWKRNYVWNVSHDIAVTNERGGEPFEYLDTLYLNGWFKSLLESDSELFSGNLCNSKVTANSVFCEAKQLGPLWSPLHPQFRRKGLSLLLIRYGTT